MDKPTKKKIETAKKLNTDIFIKKSKKIHGDTYNYSKTIYISSHSTVSIICPIHGIFKQKAYKHLDSEPQTLASQAHRPAYGTDGDYFSNPNAEDVFDYVYDIMNESNPDKYPGIYTKK